MPPKEIPSWQDQHWNSVAILLQDLKKAVDSSTNAKGMVKEDRAFLTYLWENNITTEARLAVIGVLHRALTSVRKPFADWTSKRKKRSAAEKRTHKGKLGAPRELLQLIVTHRSVFLDLPELFADLSLLPCTAYHLQPAQGSAIGQSRTRVVTQAGSKDL